MITLNPLQIHPTPVMLVKVEEEEEEDMVNREVMAKTNQEEEEEAGDSKVVVVVEEGALEVAKVKIHFLHETNYHSSYLVMFNSLKTQKVSNYVIICFFYFLHKNVQSSRIWGKKHKLFGITRQECSKY